MSKWQTWALFPMAIACTFMWWVSSPEQPAPSATNAAPPAPVPVSRPQPLDREPYVSVAAPHATVAQLSPVATPSSDAPAPEIAPAVVENARIEAMLRWRETLDEHVLGCLSSSPGTPTLTHVSFHFTYDAGTANDTLQRFLVEDVSLASQNHELVPETDDCLKQALGTALELQLPRHALAQLPRRFDETVALPIAGGPSGPPANTL